MSTAGAALGRRASPVRAKSLLTGINADRSARVVSVEAGHVHRILRRVDADIGRPWRTSPVTPPWYRQTVGLDRFRVLHARMITGGHFMTHRYDHSDTAGPIDPPTAAGSAR